AVVRDVTEQVRAHDMLEQRVAERTRELATLLEVSRAVASTLELRPLLRLVLDQLRSVVAYTGATIMSLEGEELTILEHQIPGWPEGALVGTRFPTSRVGEISLALGRGAPSIIADILDDSPPARRYRAAVGAASMARYQQGIR